MAYFPTFTQTGKIELSLLVVPIKISESLWLGQPKSQLIPNLIQCAAWCSLSIPSHELGIPVQIQGLFLAKAGVQVGELGRNDSIKLVLRTLSVMNEH